MSWCLPVSYSPDPHIRKDLTRKNSYFNGRDMIVTAGRWLPPHIRVVSLFPGFLFGMQVRRELRASYLVQLRKKESSLILKYL